MTLGASFYCLIVTHHSIGLQIAHLYTFFPPRVLHMPCIPQRFDSLYPSSILCSSALLARSEKKMKRTTAECMIKEKGRQNYLSIEAII